MILAIDPGKDKCGLAVLGDDGRVVAKMVVLRGELSNQVKFLVSRHRIKNVVVGRGAFGKGVEKELYRLPMDISVTFVPEKDSTWLARKRFWKENPPAGWLRFIPTSLRVPPAPIDDYAAVILGERYLGI